jgi:two-component system chemotaxis sensor kinase CheA
MERTQLSRSQLGSPPQTWAKRLCALCALSIFQKLLALIVLLMVFAIGGVTTYLSSVHLAEMDQGLRVKADTYAHVMAKQLTSAVAFSDRETAREVLGSLEADPDIAALRLYSRSGIELFASGVASRWAPRAIRATRAQVFAIGERVAAVIPVVSVEGPRGTLVIELSTARVTEQRDDVAWLGVLAGVSALLLGVAAAWLIARRLARRLRAIASTARQVAEGDLAQEPVRDDAHDEIGVLAAAFNKMLARLRQLIEGTRELAQREKERLEQLVGERTAQLQRRTGEMRQVFDQVEQGLLLVGRGGELAEERSAAVARLLGPLPASNNLLDYVRQFAPETADWFELMWRSLDEGVLPLEIALAQIPSSFEVAGRHLELSYKPFRDATGEPRILVVITDVTAAVERRRAEQADRESAALLLRLLEDRRGVIAFGAEVSGLLARLHGVCPEADFRRALHTLKASFSLEKLTSLAELCHELETLAGESLAAARARVPELEEQWSALTARLTDMVDVVGNRAEVREHDLARLEAAIARGASRAELVQMIASWRVERVEPRLLRFAEHARALAEKLGKGPCDVRVEVDPELRLPESRWGAFWAAFVHALNNAVDHGLPDPEQRRASGRPGRGEIRLCGRRELDRISIEVHDNGDGVDWEAVAASARRLGLPADTQADLVAALFHDGLTTRSEISTSSGRGIGMAALRAVVQYTGGTTELTSARGVGTSLRFTWPLHASAEVPVAPRPRDAGEETSWTTS